MVSKSGDAAERELVESCLSTVLNDLDRLPDFESVRSLRSRAAACEMALAGHPMADGMEASLKSDVLALSADAEALQRTLVRRPPRLRRRAR